jgi:hypothetical protein
VTATLLPTDFRWHSSSEGGRPGFDLGLVGSKTQYVDFVGPGPDTLALGCTEWRWHLIEVGPYRTAASVVVPGASGGRLGPPTSYPVPVVHSSSVRKLLCAVTGAWHPYFAMMPPENSHLAQATAGLASLLVSSPRELAAPMADVLVAALHCDLLRDLAVLMGMHFQGLRAAASHLRCQGLGGALIKRPCRVDDAFSISCHITEVSARFLRQQVWDTVSGSGPAMGDDEAIKYFCSCLSVEGDFLGDDLGAIVLCDGYDSPSSTSSSASLDLRAPLVGCLGTVASADAAAGVFSYAGGAAPEQAVVMQASHAVLRVAISPSPSSHLRLEGYRLMCDNVVLNTSGLRSLPEAASTSCGCFYIGSESGDLQCCGDVLCDVNLDGAGDECLRDAGSQTLAIR